jgi:hypothetical protein
VSSVPVVDMRDSIVEGQRNDNDSHL